jgi:cytochrome c551/c552
LFFRTKPGRDEATPAGNGIAARALGAFGHLSGTPRYVEAAQRTVALFAPSIAESPGGYSTLLEAAAALEAPPAQVLLQGDPAQCAAWRRALEVRYRPDVQVFATGDGTQLPPSLAKGPPVSTGVAAWVCRRMTCLPPLASLDAVEAALASTPRARKRAEDATRPGCRGRCCGTVPVESARRRIRCHGACRVASLTLFPLGVRMKIVLVALAGAALLASGGAHAVLTNAQAEAMMKKDGCAACHGVEKKIVGPSYVDVAAKYKADKDAVAKLSKKVKEGSTGVWGPIPMPPNAATSEADIKELVTWILTLKK